YDIDNKLVIAVASSALFDLSQSHKVFLEQGVEAYRKYQEDNIDNHLGKGAAFPFIERLLKLNDAFEERPIEVVLLSRNNPESGLRLFRTIAHYGLDISRAAFFSGSSPYKYLPTFNASLFLSADGDDVAAACKEGFAAGQILCPPLSDGDDGDIELRLAFDFDGVIAGDSSEQIYQSGGIDAFVEHEKERSATPMEAGLLGDLFKKISYFQKLEARKQFKDPNYKCLLKTAIVTARNAPSHERVVNTLKSWGVDVNEVFFLGGIEKARVLEVMRPHMFFDDQIGHLENLKSVPAVHIPFGIANKH
ncbi:MAG: 5'-nucleotidase, partial [Rikenellaceae bacterium]